MVLLLQTWLTVYYDPYLLPSHLAIGSSVLKQKIEIGDHTNLGMNSKQSHTPAAECGEVCHGHVQLRSLSRSTNMQGSIGIAGISLDCHT